MQFTIKQKAENLQDYIIEQTGHTNTFALHEVEKVKRDQEKLRKELDGNIKTQQVTVDNIEQHHPFVKEMSEQDLFTCSMYHSAKERIKLFNSKLEELDNIEKIQNEDLAEMYKQLPELLVSPIQQNE